MKLLFEGWRKFRNKVLNEQEDVLYKPNPAAQQAGFAQEVGPDGVITFRPYSGKKPKSKVPSLTPKQKEDFLSSQKPHRDTGYTHERAQKEIDSILDGKYIFDREGNETGYDSYFDTEESAIAAVKEKCDYTGMDEFCCAAVKGRKCKSLELDQFADWMPGTSFLGQYKPTEQDMLDDQD